MTHLRNLLSAAWNAIADAVAWVLKALGIALASLTLAQINAFLGFVSLVIGISYQLWKWRKEARRQHIDGKD